MHHCRPPQPGAFHHGHQAPPSASVRPVCVTKLCVIAASRGKKLVYTCMKNLLASRNLRHQLPPGVIRVSAPWSRLHPAHAPPTRHPASPANPRGIIQFSHHSVPEVKSTWH